MDETSFNHKIFEWDLLHLTAVTKETYFKNKMVTHIWHAKRFHMSVIDGNWSVPLTGKSFSEAFILASTNPQIDK